MNFTHFDNESGVRLTAKTANYHEDSELSKKADECVEYILFYYLSEKKYVIRRLELNKNILKEYSRSFKNVIKMVNRRLKDVFGLELINDDDKGDKFGIISKYEYDYEMNNNGHQLTPSLSPKIDEGESELKSQTKYSIVMITLALIFMNGNEIDSELLWDTLKRLDINKEEKKHKYLGDVNKFLTSDLVKDGYLEYEMVHGIDPPTYKFKAGYRSKLEITKKSTLNFVCQVYGGFDVCKPEEWTIQFADASKSDNNNEDEENSDHENQNNESGVEEDESDEEDSTNNQTQIVTQRRTQKGRR